MTERRADILIIGDFLAAYLGVMSAVLVGSVPALETIRAPVVLYGLLPLIALGVVTVIAANIFYPRR